MRKTISVLIPTLGREKEVIDTVTSLLAQTVVPDEIVVVDQNQPPFVRLDEFLAAIPLVRHIKTPVPGVSRNYNLCLHHATSEIVLYVDDDVIPDSRLVEMHLRNYVETEERLGGVAGRVEQPSGDLPPEKIQTFGKYRRWSGAIVARFNARLRRDVDIAPGGNMSFYRRVLQEVGGFDLGFGGNGYFFETDGSLRVIAAGYRIIFDPEADLKHLMAPAGGARVTDKAVHTYFFVKNGIRLYQRHSPALGLPYCYLRMFLYVAAKAAYNRDQRILVKGLQALWDGALQSTEVISCDSSEPVTR